MFIINEECLILNKNFRSTGKVLAMKSTSSTVSQYYNNSKNSILESQHISFSDVESLDISLVDLLYVIGEKGNFGKCFSISPEALKLLVEKTAKHFVNIYIVMSHMRHTANTPTLRSQILFSEVYCKNNKELSFVFSQLPNYHLIEDAVYSFVKNKSTTEDERLVMSSILIEFGKNFEYIRELVVLNKDNTSVIVRAFSADKLELFGFEKIVNLICDHVEKFLPISHSIHHMIPAKIFFDNYGKIDFNIPPPDRNIDTFGLYLYNMVKNYNCESVEYRFLIEYLMNTEILITMVNEKGLNVEELETIYYDAIFCADNKHKLNDIFRTMLPFMKKHVTEYRIVFNVFLFAMNFLGESLDNEDLLSNSKVLFDSDKMMQMFIEEFNRFTELCDYFGDTDLAFQLSV